MLAMLSKFDYSRIERQEDVVVVYETVKEAKNINSMGAIMYAIVIVMGFYLMIMAICWWVEYNNLAMGTPLFRWITFGIGNAKALNIKRYIGITLVIYVGMIMIVTGLLQELVVRVFVYAFKLPGFLMGIRNN